MFCVHRVCAACVPCVWVADAGKNALGALSEDERIMAQVTAAVSNRPANRRENGAKTPARKGSASSRAKKKKGGGGWLSFVVRFTVAVFVLTSLFVFAVVVPIEGLTLYQRGFQAVTGKLPDVDHTSREDQAALDNLIKRKSKEH